MIRFFVLFFFILTTISFAEIKKVNIVGNSRVNSNTIETLVDKKITNVDSIFINNLTKKIYDTEFFSDVKISYNQNILTITVVENPIHFLLPEGKVVQMNLKRNQQRFSIKMVFKMFFI